MCSCEVCGREKASNPKVVVLARVASSLSAKAAQLAAHSQQRPALPQLGVTQDMGSRPLWIHYPQTQSTGTPGAWDSDEALIPCLCLIGLDRQGYVPEGARLQELASKFQNPTPKRTAIPWDPGCWILSPFQTDQD